MDIDWVTLQDELAGRFALGRQSIHGLEHWDRVRRYGCYLTEHAGDQLVVRLFALFHDACRQNDGIDDDHGARGAVLAPQLRGRYFELPDASFALLQYACSWHTAGRISDDPTIGACWDADRLDLWRVGKMPREFLMSTEAARHLVRSNHIGPEYLP